MAKKKEESKKDNTKLKNLLKDLQKEHKGSVIQMGNEVAVKERIPTATPLDEAIGGGIPCGLFSVVWGSKGCLTGDTIVRYKTGKKYKKNSTLERLYHNFNQITQNKQGKHLRKDLVGATYYLQSIDEHDRIIMNQITDVIDSGKKQIFELTTTSGFKIKATADHKFSTENGFKPLSELQIKDNIYVNKKEKLKRKRKKPIIEKRILVPNHPYAAIKHVGKYTYYYKSNHIVIKEAEMNNLSVDVFLKRLERNNIEGLQFIDTKKYQVHHINKNHFDNSISNLEVLTKSKHAKKHYDEIIKNFLYKIVSLDSIKKIRKLSVEQTYDICMKSPYNNFLANGFVVHNSGKTSLAYSTIAEAQLLGKTCLFLDLEHSYDKARAQVFGVNTEELVVAEFAKAEMSMDTIIKLCKEKAVELIVVDSIQSMSPTGEQETKKGKELSVEHDTQALLARKLGQFFRMSAHYVSTSKCAVLLIGQSRMSIGGYITMEMLSGGNALMHWASLIVKLRRGKAVDAPMRSYKQHFIDEDTGKERYKTVKEPCGFNLVAKLDKTKIASSVEGTELQIPFFFNGGFSEQVEETKEADE